MAGVPDPGLSDEDREAFARGLAQFNDGLFYECHDTLEDVWSGVRGPSRDFFQGLIQVAVGFYHFGNGNQAGAARLLRRGLVRLRPYPARYAGVDLGPLREAVSGWLEALEAGTLPPGRPPVISMVEAS